MSAGEPAREDKYGFASRRINSVRTVELIEVVTAEGAGDTDDPVGVVARFYTHGGALVATGLPTSGPSS